MCSSSYRVNAGVILQQRFAHIWPVELIAESTIIVACTNTCQIASVIKPTSRPLSELT